MIDFYLPLSSPISYSNNEKGYENKDNHTAHSNSSYPRTVISVGPMYIIEKMGCGTSITPNDMGHCLHGYSNGFFRLWSFYNMQLDSETVFGIMDIPPPYNP